MQTSLQSFKKEEEKARVSIWTLNYKTMALFLKVKREKSFPSIQRRAYNLEFQEYCKPLKLCSVLLVCAYIHFPKSIILIIVSVGSMIHTHTKG